jgi:hypothetical protein
MFEDISKKMNSHVEYQQQQNERLNYETPNSFDTKQSNADFTNEEAQRIPNPPQSFLQRIFMKSQKTLLTFIYCISFWNFGICVAIFGPTLLDLACQTSRYPG